MGIRKFGFGLDLSFSLLGTHFVLEWLFHHHLVYRNHLLGNFHHPGLGAFQPVQRPSTLFFSDAEDTLSQDSNGD